MGRHTKHGQPYTPFYYLSKYKTTQRPRTCVRCKQNAYYYHDDYDWLCAPHLLDLINIGSVLFNWEDYPEVWQRTERLLQREPPKSGIVKNVAVDMNNAVPWEDPLDGLNLEDPYE